MDLVSPDQHPADQPDLKLQLLASFCESTSCPTIFESNRGTVVVQGYPVSAVRAGVEVPDGESLVEIPLELLTAAAARRVS